MSILIFKEKYENYFKNLSPDIQIQLSNVSVAASSYTKLILTSDFVSSLEHERPTLPCVVYEW